MSNPHIAHTYHISLYIDPHYSAAPCLLLITGLGELTNQHLECGGRIILVRDKHIRI